MDCSIEAVTLPEIVGSAAVEQAARPRIAPTPSAPAAICLPLTVFDSVLASGVNAVHRARRIRLVGGRDHCRIVWFPHARQFRATRQTAAALLNGASPDTLGSRHSTVPTGMLDISPPATGCWSPGIRGRYAARQLAVMWARNCRVLAGRARRRSGAEYSDF